MTQTDEVAAPLELKWKSRDLFVHQGSGATFVQHRSAWAIVSGLEDRVRLRPGGRIRAVVGGSPRWGYRLDLLAETTHDRVWPFWALGGGFGSLDEVQRRAMSAIASLGVVAVERSAT